MRGIYKRFLLMAVILPKLTNLLVLMYGVLLLLGDTGYINEILLLNNGNRTKTARDLGVDPRTIFRHLEKEDDGGPVESGEM